MAKAIDSRKKSARAERAGHSRLGQSTSTRSCSGQSPLRQRRADDKTWTLTIFVRTTGLSLLSPKTPLKLRLNGAPEFGFSHLGGGVDRATRPIGPLFLSIHNCQNRAIVDHGISEPRA